MMRQKGSKSLSDFLTQWKKEVTNVYGFDRNAVVSIFTNALRSGAFHSDLNRYLLKSYSNLMDRAVRFVDAEEAKKRKKEEDGEGMGKKEKGVQALIPANHGGWSTRRDCPEGPRLTPFHYLTSITLLVSTILNYAEEMGIV